MHPMVKKSVLRASRSLGYDIVPLREVKERDFALHLQQLFAQAEIDCVFDVGANIGQYHDFLRDKVYFEGPIISFEPVKRNALILRERAETDPHWFIEEYALGATDGVLDINVMHSDQFSSFLEPDNSAVEKYTGLNETAYVEPVEVRRLDEILPLALERLDFRRPYLKLDTQGFDIQVLNGATAALPFFRALQTEASVIGIYKGMPSYLDTIRFLNERNFEVTGFYPVSRDERLRLIEFDCVMRNAEEPPIGTAE